MSDDGIEVTIRSWANIWANMVAPLVATIELDPERYMELRVLHVRAERRYRRVMRARRKQRRGWA